MLSVYPPAMIASTQCSLSCFLLFLLVTYVKINILINLNDLEAKNYISWFNLLICPDAGNALPNDSAILKNNEYSK